MKVRVQGQHYLSDNDIMNIDEKKRYWWMRSMDSNYGEGEFINFWKQGISKADTIANRPLDLIIELEPGRYLAGCGDKNVMNERGYPTRQLLNFVVFPNGTTQNYKWDEMPTLEAFQQMLLDDPTLSEPPKDIPHERTPMIYDYAVYPESNQRWCKFKDTFIDDNDTCDFFKAKVETGGTLCDNCVHGVVLYYKPSDTVME